MKLKPLHRKDLIKKLRDLGFEGPFVGGKHEYLRNKNNFKIIIPNTHSGKDIPIPILKAIIKQLGIDAEEFLGLNNEN